MKTLILIFCLISFGSAMADTQVNANVNKTTTKRPPVNDDGPGPGGRPPIIPN